MGLGDLGRGRERSEESSKCSHLILYGSTVEFVKPVESMSKVSRKGPILPKMSIPRGHFS